MPFKVAIATTTWWPLAARLAVAFGILGADVGAICPDGSPLAKVSSVRALSRYAALAPERSLAGALRAMRPDLIVPCDERVVAHLHALHSSLPADDVLHQLIGRSLGAPQGYASTLSRGSALELAAQEGIRVPATRPLLSEADVRAWSAGQPMPALLKADGSWGGAGVAVVDSLASAMAAFRRLSRPPATWRVAKFLLSNRDPFPLDGWLHRGRPAVIGQGFVHGCAANTMVACWEGEVLATASAMVLASSKPFGAATVIRLVAHAEMESAATRLVRRLGLSGFCGLDFLIEQGTDKAYLIELNPRATQLGHLQIGTGGTLVAALLDRLRGKRPAVFTSPQNGRDTVAFFPQAWLSDSASPLLRSAYHDVPWEEPALVAELLRRPWESRSPLSRMTDLLLRRPDPERVLAGAFGHTRPPGPADEPARGKPVPREHAAAGPTAVPESCP